MIIQLEDNSYLDTINQFKILFHNHNIIFVYNILIYRITNRDHFDLMGFFVIDFKWPFSKVIVNVYKTL